MCVTHPALSPAPGAGLPAEFLPLSHYLRVLDVNFVGAVSVIKSCLPFLVPQSSRIVNLASTAGFLAPPLSSDYAAAKFALEGFTDSLRREMGPATHWGLSISLVESAYSRTPWAMQQKVRQRALAALPADVRQRWGEQAIAEILSADGRGEGGEEDGPQPGWATDQWVTVRALVHAVTSCSPSARYHSGWSGKAEAALALLPTKWADWLLVLRHRLRNGRGKYHNAVPAAVLCKTAGRASASDG